MDKKVTPDLRSKQWCLASNVGQFPLIFGKFAKFAFQVLSSQGLCLVILI